MPTKPNRAGEQQPMKSNGEYASFSNFQRDEEKLEKIKSLKEQYNKTSSFFAKVKIKQQIEMLEGGFSSMEEYQAYKKVQSEKAQQERDERYQKMMEERAAKKSQEEELKKQKLAQDYKESTPQQQKQFDIIQKYNPMTDEYHTGIRSPKEIKTFEETLKDADSFAWGDFSRKDAEKALKKGSITVYSSYPIKQGVFVSTSKIQSEEYAGGKGKKIYSMEIPLDKVAWISGDEGQFADIEQYKGD